MYFQVLYHYTIHMQSPTLFLTKVEPSTYYKVSERDTARPRGLLFFRFTRENGFVDLQLLGYFIIRKVSYLMKIRILDSKIN